MNNKLLYDIQDKPKKIKEWVLYALQQVLAVFVATVLIANLCGTPVSSCLLGACLGTLIYQVITKFRSPMFISSSGATVSAVTGALVLSGVSEQNYLMVAIGGLVIVIIYILFAIIIKIKGIQAINKVFPATVIGPVTMVIGLNLSKFLITYCGEFGMIDASGTVLNANGISSTYIICSILVAIFTMLVIAVSSHYFKGFLKTIPFLIGLAAGYILALILTVTNVANLVSFEPFNHLQWYPDVTFLKWNSGDFSFSNLGQTVLFFAPVAICALLEHMADHKTLSNIIGTDLTENPGLHRTLIGDGVASALGTVVCGLPNTSYGESIATTGFSKVASVWVITAAAAFLGLLSFIAPVSALIQTIPSCVFGGCAMILYGFITASGLKTLIREKVDLENNKNLIIISVILTSGVGGIVLSFALGNNKFFSFAGVALAMILGVILNLILKEPKEKTK